MPTPSHEPGISDQVIAEAVTRDHRLELHATNEHGDVVVGHTRMIGVDGDVIHVAEPQGKGKAVTFETGQEVQAYLLYAEKMYRFQTRIVNGACLVQLRGTKTTVAGMAISYPLELAEGQRRTTYRVVVISEGLIPVRLHEVMLEEPARSPLPGVCIEGAMMDLSEGGFGVRVDTPNFNCFKVGMTFSGCCSLPEIPDKLQFIAELRQTRSITNGSATKLGFMLRAWPDQIAFRRITESMRRFAVQIERKKTTGGKSRAA
jgi:c-di-GMP-binding flagellar brake protein YcgR